MTNIDKELISNKQNCYIFDIDGCMADISNILLTHEQTYNIKFEKYLQERDIYNKICIEYDKLLKKYNSGEILVEPKMPIKPIEPIRQSEDKIKGIDWEYFKNHLIDAIPIQGVLDLFTSIALTHKVILLTGRDEGCRQETIDWLKKVIVERGGYSLYRRINFQLIMRTEKEIGLPAAKYKKARVLELAKQYNIQLCIEDCPDIIQMYTDLGLLVLVPNKEYYNIGQE